MKYKTNNVPYKSLKYFFDENCVYRTKELRKLCFDDVSYYSLTPHSYSKMIVEIIKKFVDLDKTVILDACACIGGDTITFSKNFRNVVSIEKDIKRFKCLCNNVNILSTDNNIVLFNDDCIDYLSKSMYHYGVIYFDAPWGKKYKNFEKIELYINNIPLWKICLEFKDNTDYFCLKIPNNYDIDNLKHKLQKDFNISIFKIKKKFKIIMLSKL